jgi:hypothetical protein
MTPSVKAITWSFAILWGACMLLAGLIHLADPSWGGAFLNMMSSIYPGADMERTIGRVLLGTVYGFVDGAVTGYTFAMLYRVLTEHGHTEAHQ